MTDRLQEIRERHDAIIPGPWDWFGNTATDQVWLATPDRGRLILLTPALRTEEYVFDHDAGQGHTLEQAREHVIDWCSAHGEDSDPHPRARGDNCQCDALRDFLRGELHPEEGHRDYDTYRESSCRKLHLTRHVQTHTDLRFANGSLKDRRNVHGGMLKSYRETGVRYEVLGYRTTAEWERDQTDVTATAAASREVRHALYREDFKGIDNPEADFIARSPEDIGYLLKRLEAAEEHIEALQQLCMWENRGQALQGTVDARALAATTLACWEGNQ